MSLSMALVSIGSFSTAIKNVFDNFNDVKVDKIDALK